MPGFTHTLSLPVTDTIHGFVPDTLTAQVPETLAPTEVWDAVAVYGPGSVKIANTVPEAIAEQSLLTGNIWFQILTLVIFAAYCFMIYYYREQVWMCLKGLVNFKTESRFTAEHGHLYNRFTAYAVFLSTITAGIGLTKVVAVVAEPAILAAIPGWMIPLVSLLFWALVCVVVSVQAGILKAAGKLTYSTAFTDTLTEIKAMHLAVGAIFVTPAVILYSGLNSMWDAIMLYITAALTFIIITAFLSRTFLLFVRQKVSLLVWILYLCAVEIFPLALITALLVKNF